MESFTLGWLAGAVGAAAPEGTRDLRLDGVSTDTRALRPGALFVALDGESFEGARFVPAAFARGARAAIVRRDAAVASTPGRPVLRVDCPRRALAAIAQAYRDRLGDLEVVAITGSAGKTTTKDLVHHVLRAARSAVRAEASFNNDVGVPLTLLLADRATGVAVVECGTSGPGEIARLGAIARPHVAVITCVGAAHLEGLGSLEGVAREKLSLLDHLRPGGLAVLNGDDPRVAAAAPRLAAERGADAVRLVRLGPPPAVDPASGPADAAGRPLVEVRGEVAARDGARWTARTWIGGAPGPELALPVPGEPFLRAALAALAVAERLGVAPAQAADALRSFRAPKGRCAVSIERGVTLVDDTYNANPESVRACLETLRALASPDDRVAVLGGMAELGESGPERHRAIGERVAAIGVRRLVTVGADARAIAEGARAAGLADDRIVALDRPEDVAPALARELAPGRVVTFKASRVHRLERAVATVRAALRAA